MNVAALLDAVPGAALDEGYGLVTVDVPTSWWRAAVVLARTELGCSFLDFLSAVDEPDGFRVVCHLAALDPFGHLVVRTLLPREAPAVASLSEEYAGAGWHERETAEMFGITFLGPDEEPLELPGLLLPPGFEGHPLRKDHWLAARQERPWPGAKEPGESDQDATPSRRRLRPPGVPEVTT
ncbi:MAG TPA: NADH-quinone oxidoreductase subunit C [Marmoricola sp.]|nr:NADH-quinone oxidoreductase subunit C [Marmoricola sp.]